MYEFRNSYLHVVVDEAVKLMYSEWVRKPTREEYREAAAIIAGCIRDNGIECWIQGTDNLGAVSSSDLKWVMKEILPAAASSALKKIARITSDDKSMTVFMGLASQAQTEHSTAIRVQQFKTYREAADWIADRF